MVETIKGTIPWLDPSSQASREGEFTRAGEARVGETLRIVAYRVVLLDGLLLTIICDEMGA